MEVKKLTDLGGGYFSTLVPLLLSLGDKYGTNLVCGIAAEGHRIGFTTFKKTNDAYSDLNENGKMLNVLSEHGFEVLNHSMTAQIPQNTFAVDSINTDLADRIYTEGSGSSPLSFQNTIVLDKSTGKWYEKNKESSVWVERVPNRKYALPFYRDYDSGVWHINRNFDFDYNWGEWFKRANELGLKCVNLIVHNGSTTHPFTIANSRRYAKASFHTSGKHNQPPLSAAVRRMNAVNSGKNMRDESYAETLTKAVKKCVRDKCWLVLMTHFYTTEFDNYYLAGNNYTNMDENYNPEWIHPLIREEIQSMDYNDYWNKPPKRLGITRWSQWIPANGTQLRTLYDTLDYALKRGASIVPPSKGLEIFGNIVQYGVDSNGQNYSYSVDESELTDVEKSYITIGADGSIRIHSNK